MIGAELYTVNNIDKTLDGKGSFFLCAGRGVYSPGGALSRKYGIYILGSDFKGR